VTIHIESKATSRDQSFEEAHRAMHKKGFHVTTGACRAITHVVRREEPEEELECGVIRERSKR